MSDDTPRVWTQLTIGLQQTGTSGETAELVYAGLVGLNVDIVTYPTAREAAQRISVSVHGIEQEEVAPYRCFFRVGTLAKGDWVANPKWSLCFDRIARIEVG